MFELSPALLHWQPLLVLLLALLLDALLGEPRRWHPLVGFGHWAGWLEAHCRRLPVPARLQGLLAWGLAVLPPALLCAWLVSGLSGWALIACEAALLYACIAPRSLAEHAAAIARPLARGDLPAAREALGRIVSRDTGALDERGIAAGTLESVLENGSDGVFAAVFWYLLAGPAGAVGYRLANTLDAMWGYRTPRYLAFGWAAARLDDLLNVIPARLTALSYACSGRTRTAIRCWRAQAARWKSPNAGPVMASGAGALGIALGGAACYHGEWQTRPALGDGAPPTARDIPRALALLWRALALWCAALALLLWVTA